MFPRFPKAKSNTLAQCVRALLSRGGASLTEIVDIAEGSVIARNVNPGWKISNSCLLGYLLQVGWSTCDGPLAIDTLWLNPAQHEYLNNSQPMPIPFCRLAQTQEMYEQYQQKLRSQKYFGLQPTSRREAIPMKRSAAAFAGWLMKASGWRRSRVHIRGVNNKMAIFWPY